MINRIFDGYKFRRTYIGGSKKNENISFRVVGGVNEDASDCDWVEYNRLLTIHFDDILHVLLTWKTITLKISIGLILASILFFKIPLLFSILIGLSGLLMIAHLILKVRESRMLGAYGLFLGVVKFKINELYGLN
jgi:hypothetical protein